MGLMLSCCALDAGTPRMLNILIINYCCLGFGLATKTLGCLCFALPWGRSTGARFLTTAIFFLFTLIAYLAQYTFNFLLNLAVILG